MRGGCISPGKKYKSKSKQNYVKQKSSAVKETSHKSKRKPTCGKRYLHIIHLIRDCYSKKNSANLIKNINNQIKDR